MAPGHAAALRRDPELADVLADIQERLRDIEQHVRTPEYDEKLAIVEAHAAPYALAFLHEIRRLDKMLLGSTEHIKQVWEP